MAEVVSLDRYIKFESNRLKYYYELVMQLEH